MSRIVTGLAKMGSAPTEKRERQRKRELEKSASQTRSIVKMFSAQFNKNKSDNTKSHAQSLIIFFCAQKCTKRGVEKGEAKVELRTQAVNDLEEFLLNNYRHILAPKSSYYHIK